MNVSEKIIDTVITNQFSTAFQATANHNTIELSGFGKFTFSQVKARKAMEKYNAQIALYQSIISNPDSSPELVRNNKLRLNTTLRNIEYLKPKMKL